MEVDPNHARRALSTRAWRRHGAGSAGSRSAPRVVDTLPGMCNRTGIAFGEAQLTQEIVAGRDVLDVGSLDVNGSLRPFVETLGPRRYLGVDITAGPGVDEVLDASRLVERFGPESFDLVITTEMLEHVRDWQVVVSNLKQVIRPGGELLLTTRSIGFPYHSYPYDFWRYEPEDMRAIFADFEIVALERDRAAPGVFLLARKPSDFVEKPVARPLHSMVVGRRRRAVSDREIRASRLIRKARSTVEPVTKRLAPGLGALARIARRRVVAPVWRRLPLPVRSRVKRAVRRG
jgi:SAM-dependent methyltransferase